MSDSQPQGKPASRIVPGDIVIVSGVYRTVRASYGIRCCGGGTTWRLAFTDGQILFCPLDAVLSM